MFAYTVEKDKTIRSLDDKIIFFSFEKFRDEICNNGHCFVCGAKPNNSFNDEHVFSNWILSSTGIHNETLTLPNKNLARYSTYKIPCCENCNSKLNDIYEKPISKAFDSGYQSVINFLKKGGHHLICAWMSLIFFKVHLKDFNNRDSLDLRHNTGFIGDEYDLHELHHVHAVARAATAGISIDQAVFGSLIVFNIDETSNVKEFDYCDSLAGRTMLLRINNIALIYVLDDCGATIGMLKEQLRTVPNKLSALQLREIYARYSAANVHIKSIPTFKTEITSTKPRISVDLPKFEIFDYNPLVFGAIFANALESNKNNITINGLSGDDVLKKISSGRISFLN